MSWLSTNSAAINQWVDTLSKLALITSLIVGGFWTYILFVRKDAPALEFHAGFDTDIRWTDAGEKDLCWGIVRATLKNEGIKPFNVTEIYLRGWYYPIAMSHGNDERANPAPDVGHPAVLNVQRIMSRQPDVTHVFNASNSTLPGGDLLPGLLSHYPPGAEANQETKFVFKRDPKSAVLFKIDVKTGENFHFIPSSFVDDTVCGGRAEPESKPSR